MLKEDFLTYQAKTTPHPLGIAVAKAKGVYITDTQKKNTLTLFQEFQRVV